MGGNIPDDTFAEPQAGPVDGLWTEAFGCKKLEHLAGAQQVEGADLRHHVVGDQSNCAVEPVLDRAAALHEVAQLPHQRPRPSPSPALGAAHGAPLGLRVTASIGYAESSP